jgi:uncharacterized Ntn-hydrolase superfamily protein
MPRCSIILVPLLALGARPALATYSVVATDSRTRQVGGAVTSCVGTNDVSFVFGAAPGKGGINAQASANTAGRDRGVALLGMDTAPADIIAAITASSFDARSATRQYGVADLAGRAAGFTGTSAQSYKEDRQGNEGTYTFSVQGNILTSRLVLDQAEAAFRGRGCDLAEKLMLALEAGAANGEGDSRCTPRGIPSDSASIEVDPADMAVGSYLRLSVRGTGSASPLVSLRTMFDAWRATHPCAGATTDGGASGSGGSGVGGRGGTGGRGGAGTGGAATGGAATGGRGFGGVGSGGAGSGGANTGGAGSGGANTRGDGAMTGSDPDAGCSCGAAGQAPRTQLGCLFLLGLLVLSATRARR